jgi:hypothetical protein
VRLSTDDLDQILKANIALLEDDPDAVALEFDISDDGDVLGLVLVHQRLTTKKSSLKAIAAAPLGLPSLPLRMERGTLPVDEIAEVDVEPLHDEALVDSNIGLGGTKVCEGGGCGTLTLSGASISIIHDGRSCGSTAPFLLSNSHVFHRAGGVVEHRKSPIGLVTCVFDLEAKTTFDAGVAASNASVPSSNAFKVLNPNGEPLQIDRLVTAEPRMKVAKMGMVSGWTEGRVGSPTITRIFGHRALYPCWKATYRSRGGDSGSPILWKDENGLWCLVGIHFSSGPQFQSWNNAEVTVARD